MYFISSWPLKTDHYLSYLTAVRLRPFRNDLGTSFPFSGSLDSTDFLSSTVSLFLKTDVIKKIVESFQKSNLTLRCSPVKAAKKKRVCVH